MTLVSLQTLHVLGWTLLHFVWQGAALAALLAAGLMVSRNANVRYALGIGTLMLMMAAPVVTFAWLNRAPSPVASFETALPTAAFDTSSIDEVAPSSSRAIVDVLAAKTTRGDLEDLMVWLVQAWFVGVMLLSVRTAGGLLWLARTRRGEIEPLSEEMYRQCLILQRKMGLQQHIRYGQSSSLDSPVVLGWFRPIVIVTTQAMTGLTPQQLHAIIAHELAHIRRYDAFVNLFQVVAEMLLFYHPAVWWVSRRIRIEREVCCDHEALAACGEPVSYARALTMMEEWRASPVMSMAANRGPLTERVLRLLGMQGTSARSRVAGLGACALAVVVALFAGSVFVAAAQTTSDEQSALPVIEPESQIVAAEPAPAAVPADPAEPAPAAMSVLMAQPASPAQAAVPVAPALSRRAVLAAQLASEPAPAPRAAPAPKPAAAPKPVEAPRSAASPQPATSPRLAAVAQSATPPRAAEQTPASSEASNKKGSSYIQGVKAAGLRDVSIDQLIAMKVQGITPAYVERMLATSLHPGVDQLIAMKVHDVTPEYVEQMRQIVADVDVDRAIAMKIHGITPQYIREMQSAGMDIRTADEFITAKAMKITPDVIKSALDQGFQDLTVEKLMMLKNIDII